MKKSYIPDIDLSLENFKEFLQEREKLIVSAFKELLVQICKSITIIFHHLEFKQTKLRGICPSVLAAYRL